MVRRDGENVVVRMGFSHGQRGKVAAEVAALQALQPLQGFHVPRLLAHGLTHEPSLLGLCDH